MYMSFPVFYNYRLKSESDEYTVYKHSFKQVQYNRIKFEKISSW